MARVSATLARGLVLGTFTTMLSACYVVPLVPETGGSAPVGWTVPAPFVVPPGTPAWVATAPPALPARPLSARLYPQNDAASRLGFLSGTVADLGGGRGRFELDVEGERLVGEATRTGSDGGRGVASAIGPRGTSLRCDYTMRAIDVGVGSCTLSGGARYQVHLGR